MPRKNAMRELRYVARRIVEDDNTILADEALDSDKTIAYAIDFSELFSYVFLDRLPYTSRDRDRRFMLSVGFNEMVLHELLLSGNYTLFMLPQHRLELRQLIGTIDERELSELGHILAATEKTLTLNRSLVDALNRFEADSSKIAVDQELVAKIVNEAANDAPHILLLARTANANPRQRLNYLLNHVKLASLNSELLQNTTIPSIEEEIASKAMSIFEKLRPQKPDSTNRLDARAVAHLTSLINHAPPKLAIRFVSRSAAFKTVCDTLAAQGNIPMNVADAIRHPRAFSAYVLARSTDRPITHFISQRLNAAQLFISALDKPSLGSTVLTQSASTLNMTVQEIERIAMLSSLAEAPEAASSSKMQTSFHDIRYLVALLRDHFQVRQAVHARAQKVVDKLSVGTVEIAGSIAASFMNEQADLSTLNANILPKTEKTQNSATSVAIARFNYAPVPYSLEFYASYISSRISKGDIPYNALSKFISFTDYENSYERRLATAYLLGLREDWDLSLRFVDAALDGLLSTDNTPRQEGYYFRAVARRNALPWTEENILASLKDVTQAQEIRSAALGKRSDDPRYLNERANVIFQARRIGVQQKLLDELNANDDPISLWRKILKQDTSIAYKLNALNNITFFFLVSRDREKTKESVSELIAFIEKNKYIRLELPPSVQETILSSQLFVGMFSNSAEMEKASTELAQIRAKHPYVNKTPVRTS